MSHPINSSDERIAQIAAFVGDAAHASAMSRPYHDAACAALSELDAELARLRAALEAADALRKEAERFVDYDHPCRTREAALAYDTARAKVKP